MRKLNFKEQAPLKNELVELLTKTFDELHKSGSITENRPGDARIFGFENHLPPSVSNIFFEKHRLYCKAHTHKTPRNMTLMLNKTWFDINGLGSGAGWHRDSGLRLQHKTFTYLSNVTKDTGPFTIRDYQNYALSLIQNPRTRISENHNINPRIGSVIDHQVLGTAGHIFSCCTNFIHRGFPVKQGTRYMATVYAYY